MKQLLKQKIIITGLLIIPMITNAQFGTIGTIGRTLNAGPNVTGVGIGFFPTVPSLNARLHVNNFLLGAPAGPLNGLLFRTDGDQSVVNQWQLFTGATNLTTTEKFKLFVPANSNSVFFQHSQIGGIMGFNTGGAVTRMLITDGGTGAADGRVGFGNNLPNGFLPQQRLHLHHTSTTDVYARFTNTNTGLTLTDGCDFGIDDTGIGVIRQNENLPISFAVNSGLTPLGTNRMTIHAGTYLINGVNTNNRTRVGIWETGTGVNFMQQNNILSMLHLGDNTGAPNNNGHRDWMNTGTYMNIGTDNMYIGLRRRAFDIADAIINWGDNPTQTTAPDRLLFVFTGVFNGGLGQQSTYDGLETGRIRVDLNSRPFIGWGGDPFTNPYSTGVDPGNTIEINSPLIGLSPNASGLRFTDMNSTLVPIPNPGQGVLSVDANGDVIYVPAGATSSFGSLCGSTTPTQLSGNSEIQLNNFDFHFSGQGGLNNNVGIGTACFGPLGGKLHVFQNSGNTGTNGIFVLNIDDCGTAFNQEVKGIQVTVPGVSNTNGVGQIGGQFITSGQKFNRAVDGLANGVNGNSFTFNVGGKFEGVNGGLNVGVWGVAPLTSGNFAGLFDGDVQFNGNVLGSQFGWTSDLMFKINVSPITNSLSIVEQLNPKSFYFDTTSYSYMNFSSAKQYGFIAQDVEQILPELVNNAKTPPVIDSLGNIIVQPINYKTLNYNAFIGLLVQSVKELKQQVDSLSQNNVRHSNTTSPHNTTVDLVSDIVLYQNAPNPFGESTIIKYYLPANVVGAKMIFMDETGRIIKEVMLDQTGDGQVTVNAQDLASGIYTYSLYVNGQNVQTRKMQKVK